MERNDAIAAMFQKSLLAASMERKEVLDFLSSSRVRLMECAPGEIVFFEGDIPQCLYVLLSGEVHIQKDSFSGRRIFLSEINEPGDIFGEVYLLLGKPYDMFVEAAEKTALLAIGSEAFSLGAGDSSPAVRRVQRNLMEILARKAYFMHNKLKVMASGSLRERIVRFLFWEMGGGDSIRLSIGRDAWAAYLSTARPSLSRELSAMQREGILSVEGKEIRIRNREAFEEYL